MTNHTPNILIAYISFFVFAAAFKVTLGTWDPENPQAFYGGFLVFLSFVAPIHTTIVAGLFILTERINALREQ